MGRGGTITLDRRFPKKKTMERIPTRKETQRDITQRSNRLGRPHIDIVHSKPCEAGEKG